METRGLIRMLVVAMLPAALAQTGAAQEFSNETLRSAGGLIKAARQSIFPREPAPAAETSSLGNEESLKAIKEAAARANGACSEHWKCLDEIPAAVKLADFTRIAAHAVTWYRQMARGRTPAYPVRSDRYYLIESLGPDRHAALDHASKRPVGYRFRQALGTWGGPSMFSLRYYADFYYRGDGGFLGIEVSGYSSPAIRSFPLEALPDHLAKELLGTS